jgi:hypothetical protein
MGEGKWSHMRKASKKQKKAMQADYNKQLEEEEYGNQKNKKSK